MNIYQDFDHEENTDFNNTKVKRKGKDKDKKNVFVYETFNDRIKKIKVRLTNNLQNDVSFMKVEEGDSFKYSEAESNFLTMLNREKVLNATPEFIQFLAEIKPYTGSYLLMINNSSKLIKIFASTLENELNPKREDGTVSEMLDRFQENALNQRNYPFIHSVLEVMIGFIKDIREDASETFLSSILPNLIKLLTNSANTDVIDKTFSVFVNIFKFLQKGIHKNFRQFFLIFSELIFHKNKSMRKFSCESICFLIKSLDKKELSDSLKIIFEVFNNPEMIFSDLNILKEGGEDKNNQNEKNENEKMDIEVEGDNLNTKINFDELLLEHTKKEFKNSKEFLYKIILNFKPQSDHVRNLYMFMLDSVSDLLFEILVGINKNLSIRADLILEKIFVCFNEEEKEEDDSNPNQNMKYLCFMKNVTVIDTILKLFHYVTENQKKNVISLFHYYLSFFPSTNSNNKKNFNLTYPKLNIENLPSQLNYLAINNFTINTQIYCYIFIREFILKFYNKIDNKMISYFIDFFKKLNNNENKDNNLILSNKIFAVEIISIFLKFNPEDFMSGYKIKINDNKDTNILNIPNNISTILFKNFYSSEKEFYFLDRFMEELKTLQNYNEFLALQFFDKRKNPNSHTEVNNDDYDSIYDNDIITFFFDTILNTIPLQSHTQILNIITSYEFLMIDKSNIYTSAQEDSNKFKSLKLNLQHNKNLITNFLSLSNKNFSIKEDFNLETYMSLYTQIILINLIKEETGNYSETFIEKLLSFIEQYNDMSESIVTKGLKNSGYFNILFNEFNNENTYYSSKKYTLLNLLHYLITVCGEEFLTMKSNFVKRVLKILLENSLYGVVYKMLNSLITFNFSDNLTEFIYFTNDILEFNSDFITSTCKILLINNNKYKSEYLKFIKFIYFSESNRNSQNFQNSQVLNIAGSFVTEIFTVMEDTLEIVFDFKNDKSYTFNFEVLMSKLESLILNENNHLHFYIYLLAFYFLTGSYWIRYTKSVWGVLTKNIERYNEIINNLSNNNGGNDTSNAKFFTTLKKQINCQIEDMSSLIQNIGTNEDFISKYGVNSKIIESYYLIFKEDKIANHHNLEEINLKKNLISLTFLYKQDTMSSVSLLYEGYLQSLNGYSVILNTSEEIMEMFLNSTIEHLKVCGGKNNFLDTDTEKSKKKDEKNEKDEKKYFLCLFNNYIIDKDHKSGVLLKKFVEALLLVLSKCNLKKISKFYNNNNNNFISYFKNVLYQYIVISKSQQIQKYCICILINLEERLKPFKNLLEGIIDNTNVIDRLHNLETLTSDNGILIKSDEREILIPLVIRLYYSKYFYLSNDNKKLRTKNKINLVSFFIQLKREEFDEYVKIVFEPLSNSISDYDTNKDTILFKSETGIENVNEYFMKSFKFYNYDLRAYKKVLEILTLNLKQITSLFENSVCFISIFMMNILIFLKNLNSFIKTFENKENKQDTFFDLFYSSVNEELSNTKYINYFNRDGLSQYINFFQKNVKDIKKQTFILLKTVISKFYNKNKLISFLTTGICTKYNNFNKEYDFSTLSKPNSMLEFFLSFAKNPHLHFIYIENTGLFRKLLEIMKGEALEGAMLKSLLDLLDNILKPYHSLKIEIVRDQFITEKAEKEGKIEKEEQKLNKLENHINNNENIIEDDSKMIIDEKENKSQISLSDDDNNNGVIIEELNLNQDFSGMDLPTLSKELLLQNETQLIINNFTQINDNLLSLVKNKKVNLTIKDFNTRKVIEILVYLWNLFSSTEINISHESIQDLLHFLVNLLKHDNKIFKYENIQTLTDVLKICHMLFKIYPSEKQYYYRDFVLLLYKIQDNDSNNKLILTILMQEFADYYGDYETFSQILILISNLNLLKKRGNKKTLDDGGNSNLDADNSIDVLNEINNEFLAKFKFYHLEPLIYQLFVFSRSEDYSLQTIAVAKLKTVFESLSNLHILLGEGLIEAEGQGQGINTNSNYNYNNNNLQTRNENFTFKLVFNTMFKLLSGEGKNMSINLSKAILEILAHINTLLQNSLNTDAIRALTNELVCHDLFLLKLSDSDYNFFDAVLNIKYEVRCDAVITLRNNLKNLNYFSIMKVVIPVIKAFLTPYTYEKKKYGSVGYNSFKLEKEINRLINESIETLPIVCEVLNLQDLKDFLMSFHNQILRLNKKSSSGSNNNSGSAGGSSYGKGTVSLDLQSMLYKSLTKMIEAITKLYFTSKFDFDTQFAITMREMIEDYNTQTMNKLEDNARTNNLNGNPMVANFENASVMNRDLFKKVFEKLSVDFNKFKNNPNRDPTNTSSYLENDIFFLLKSDIYKTIKHILIDLWKKEKGKSYYIRNYAIRPFVQLLKLLDPYQIKYELIQINYNLINNLKNRDLVVRERSREGIQILFESIGVFISSMMFDELKSQLHSGYQRYIMGYTCNSIITMINKTENPDDIRLVFDFSSSLIMPILLDELFGEVAEEKEIEQLVRKYKEAKQTKSFQSLFSMCSKIDLKNGLVNVIYPLWSYLIKRDNDVTVFNKVGEAINHMVKGFKNNPTLGFNDILCYSNALVKLGIDINIKNSKEINENKRVTLKGDDGQRNESVKKSRVKDYTQQKSELFTLQVGVTNGKNYTMQISEKFISNKNEVVLSNMYTGLGLDIFLISIKKKLFDFSPTSNEILNMKTLHNENISSLLQNVISCLEISNGNILSKTLKILTRLFDCKIFIIKKNLRRIVKHLFRNLNMINSQDVSLSQTILSSIGDILSKFKYTDISDNKLKVLINFIKLNASNSQIKPYVYSCFLSIIKRKILHPSIYDMVNFIQENYLTAFEENTFTVCQNIIMEFLSTYPLEETRIISHINFFIINLESATRKCVINSLKMIYKIFENFYSDSNNNKKEFMNGLVDFIILKLLTILTNSDDSEIKSLIVINLEKIFGLVDAKKEEGYLNKVLVWLDVKSIARDRSLIKLSLNLLSILCNSRKDTIESKANVLRDLVFANIKEEIRVFEIELEKKIESEDYTNENKGDKDLDRLFKISRDNDEGVENINEEDNIEDEEEDNINEDEAELPSVNKNKTNKGLDNHSDNNLTILNLQFANWDILYLSLVILEKIYLIYPTIITTKFKSNEFCNLIVKCLKHPHVFIKTIIMRLINYILKEGGVNTSNSNNKLCLLNANTVDFLFTNFKFFILNNDTNDKLSLLAIENSDLLITHINKINNNDNSLFNISLEFVCRLYMESKSFLSNRETSSIIFNRIFDLFDKMIESLSTLNQNVLTSFVDPMLSMCYRIVSNRLVDEELKQRTEQVLNNLRGKVDPDLIANRYKEIKDNINFLKRKRKVGLLQNSLSNPKEYIKKKYKK